MLSWSRPITKEEIKIVINIQCTYLTKQCGLIRTVNRRRKGGSFSNMANRSQTTVSSIQKFYKTPTVSCDWRMVFSYSHFKEASTSGPFYNCEFWILYLWIWMTMVSITNKNQVFVLKVTKVKHKQSLQCLFIKRAE